MLLLSCKTNQNKKINNKTQETMVKENIYQFKVVIGKCIRFHYYKEKKSDDCKYSIKCGLTPQYED
jgi:hypothetical protein